MVEGFAFLIPIEINVEHQWFTDRHANQSRLHGRCADYLDTEAVRRLCGQQRMFSGDLLVGVLRDQLRQHIEFSEIEFGNRMRFHIGVALARDPHFLWSVDGNFSHIVLREERLQWTQMGSDRDIASHWITVNVDCLASDRGA